MKIKIYLLTTLLVALNILQTFAQNIEENNAPQLNGHLFTPIRGNQNPFINTFFGLNLGVAYSENFERVFRNWEGDRIAGLSGNLLFADLSFEYQQKIKDWIALYAGAGLTARVGTELQSMLSQGVTSATVFRLGWLVRIYHSEKAMLSATIQINNNEATFVNIGQFLRDVLIDSIPSSISQQVPALNGITGLRFAYGASDLLGFLINGEVGFGEKFQRGATEFFYDFYTGIDINLAQRTRVPIGFLIYARLNSVPDYVYVDDKSAVTGCLKISYNGALNYNLALELTRTQLPIPNVENKVATTGIFLTSRYFFK